MNHWGFSWITEDSHESLIILIKNQEVQLNRAWMLSDSITSDVQVIILIILKIYRACVQIMLTYGTETWAMKAENLHSLKRTEHKLRSAYDVMTFEHPDTIMMS